jgi:hypothetical protein
MEKAGIKEKPVLYKAFRDIETENELSPSENPVIHKGLISLILDILSVFKFSIFILFIMLKRIILFYGFCFIVITIAPTIASNNIIEVKISHIL